MLIDTIKTDLDAARKGDDAVAKSLLVTLYAEAAKVGKDKRNGPSTDEEVIATVKKFVGNAEETLGHLAKGSAASERIAAVKHEIAILNGYLPRQMSDAEIEAAARAIVAELGVSGPKAMGQVMGVLKERHAGTYDGRAASGIVKSVLAG